ncbi:MAG: HRDC domain-containing protein, partial [Deltaproteobacteria bacterium]|nr:HRDC domain-containing protein [Deltaproteobacteria bacterium]
FLRILDEARRLPEEALPEPAPEPVPHPRRGAGNSLLKDLKNWRRNAAQELGLDPGTLINNHMLEEIARCRPRTLTALSTISGIKQWQLRELGNSLLRQVTHHAQSHSGSGKTPQTDSP